jgi:hypothetical protein
MSAEVVLAPESVEAIAQRLAELLQEQEAPQFATADELARLLKISRDTVYEHADLLGAMRLGEGPKAPLRFEVKQALAAWTRRTAGEGSQAAEAPAPTRKRRRRTRVRSGASGRRLAGGGAR